MMSDLKLVPARESRSGGVWSAEDYDVVLVETGLSVGRIYAQMGTKIWWGASHSLTP